MLNSGECGACASILTMITSPCSSKSAARGTSPYLPFDLRILNKILTHRPRDIRFKFAWYFNIYKPNIERHLPIHFAQCVAHMPL